MYAAGDVSLMSQDPNKQAFPLISGVAQQPLHEDTAPSPAKEMEALTSSSKASIELPKLMAAREDSNAPPGRDQDYALKPKLPLVRRSRYSRAGPKPDPDRDELTERFETTDSLPYQASNFRSSTVMRSVSIQKKKDSNRLAIKSTPYSLSKQRAVAVHTQPFLWTNVQEAEKPMEPQSLPEKFLAEKERLDQVRGQKRRLMHPTHRQRYSDLHIGGLAQNFTNRLDYRDEFNKVKHAVLPTEAQELYLGRGIEFPSSHSTVVRKKQWHERIKQEACLPTSAPTHLPAHHASAPPTLDPVRPRQSVTAPPGPKHKNDRRPVNDLPSVPPPVQRSPVRPKMTRRESKQDDSGISTADAASIRGPRTESRYSEGQRSRKNNGEVRTVEKPKKEMNSESRGGKRKETTQEDKPRVIMTSDDPKTEKMETEEAEKELAASPKPPEFILEQPDDDNSNGVSLPRPDSEMDIDEPLEDTGTNILRPITQQSATPVKPPSPNPLTSADLHINITPQRREELARCFTKLDKDKDGHITFRELETTFPENLSRAQQRYIKEAYELVSASTFFGLEEFVTISHLCGRLAKLTGPPRDAFEKLNISALQQNITQFVVMFSTVDRQQTGCISLASFKELLAMVLDKELVSSSSLFDDILSGIGKMGSLSVDKVDYLVFIPYFLMFK